METQKVDLHQFATTVIAELGADSMRTFAPILRLLANGRPVPLAEVAVASGASIAQVKSFLTQFGGEFDQEGDLIGLGLTQKPTPHRFEVDGHRLYAWCATDTLWFPMILGRPARVETTDPVSGAKILLVLTPDRVEQVEPRSAVLSWATDFDGRDIRGTFCTYGHWFSSAETAAEYTAKHHGVAILRAEDVRQILRIVAAQSQIRL